MACISTFEVNAASTRSKAVAIKVKFNQIFDHKFFRRLYSVHTTLELVLEKKIRAFKQKSPQDFSNFLIAF